MSARALALALLCGCVRVPALHTARGEPATRDLDTDLEAVLELDRLRGSCEAVREGERDPAVRLRCGKWMFFRETFGTVGIPRRLVDYALQRFPGFYGDRFAKLGMVPGPDALPVGLAPGRDFEVAFTCAACHFGRMPDGRYAVGWGNTRLQYGRLMATLGAPLRLTFDEADAKVAPEVRALMLPHVRGAAQRAGHHLESLVLGLSLYSLQGSAPDVETQRRWLQIAPGTMDFLIAPLVDDHVWTVSRILPLWNLKPAPHEHLGWNGGVRTLDDFLQGFAAIGHSPGTTPEQLGPLREYLQTLSAPPPLESITSEVRAAGEALYRDRGCAGCHDAPARVFAFSELEIDDAYAQIYNPGPDGLPCCGLSADPTVVTRGVKAPRLEGIFSATRLLHDGSLGSLEQLFCLTPRPVNEGRGHRATCEGLDDADKRTLIAWLRSR